MGSNLLFVAVMMVKLTITDWAVEPYDYKTVPEHGIKVSCNVSYVPVKSPPDKWVTARVNVPVELAREGWYINYVYNPDDPRLDLEATTVSFHYLGDKRQKQSTVGWFLLENNNQETIRQRYKVVILLRHRGTITDKDNPAIQQAIDRLKTDLPLTITVHTEFKDDRRE